MGLLDKQEKIKELTKDIDALKSSIRDHCDSKRISDQEHDLEVARLRSGHDLAMKEKEFEIIHFKDDEIKKIREENITVLRDYAVLKKENELLKSITDLNADIIDVKDLVSKLIEKLASIDLKSLTVNNNNKE